MRNAGTVRTGTSESISLAGRQVEFRLVPSKFAKKLRVRVGIGGVEVIRPQGRDETEVLDFLRTNATWIVSQIEHIERFRGIRRARQRVAGRILFRGELTSVGIEEQPQGAGANRIAYDSGRITILLSPASVTPPARSLENWLRKKARTEIVSHLDVVTTRLKREPDKVLIMGQRTKWGNCSALKNLSFNWRLIMAPDFVLRYLVTHEAVHLAIPDHSQRFWLTVRSLCPESERARQWLCANGHSLLVDLAEVCGQQCSAA
jgi:predicted metal-dependent hydrolase